MEPLQALVLAEDLATVACGGFNSLSLLLYWARARPGSPRRIGAATLALLNAGVVAEGAFFLALYQSHLWLGKTGAFLTPPPWLASRTLLFLSTAAISLLILRRRPNGG